MRRVTALVLSILFSVSMVLPLVSTSAHWNHRSAVSRHRKHRHSRAWWRRYRVRMRRQRVQQRAALARRRALTAQSGHYGTAPAADIERAVQINGSAVADRRANDSRGATSLLMSERKSTTPVTVNGKTEFRLYAQNGQSVGRASLSPVAVTPLNVSLMNARDKRRQLGGVPFADLRRQVIEKMIASNGWVINDMEREINGRHVFVVIAQTAASPDGRAQAETWNFYFTEIDGRIYSLAAHAPLDSLEQMAAESERVLATLPTNNRSALMENANR
jgi:hypothetical protein